MRPENAHFDPAAGRRTILQQDGVQIHTMEHLLAAVAGLGIDNLMIETSTHGDRPSRADGSAAPIARAAARGRDRRAGRARSATSR